MDALGAGLLSAFGNFGLGIGGAMDQQRKDALEREKLEQERSLRQQVIDAQASQFAATQAAAERDKYSQMSDLAAFAQQIGLKLPDTMGPTAAKFPTAWGPEILKEASARQAKEQEQALRMQQANVLERLGAGTPAGPAQLAGQLAEGEDPEAAALIPRVQTPATPGIPKLTALAGLLREGPLTEYLVNALKEQTPTYGTAAPGSALTRNGALTGETVPALPKDNRLSVKTEVRADGTYAITTDTLTGETTAAKIPGVPGQPQFAPQQPQQPTAAQSFTTAMQNYQAARDAYGEEDPRTKNLGAIAAGLRRVDPESGTPITTPKTVNPLQQAVADIIAGRPAPGRGITPPGTPRPAPAAPAAVPPSPFPGAIRIMGQDGRGGWLRPGEPMPAGARAVP